MSGQKRPEMKWHDVETLIFYELLIAIDMRTNRFVLFMEYERDNVVPRYRPRVAGFIDKN